jgi:hypothetical protein
MQQWHLTTRSRKKEHNASRQVFNRDRYISSWPQYGQLRNPILRTTTTPPTTCQTIWVPAHRVFTVSISMQAIQARPPGLSFFSSKPRYSWCYEYVLHYSAYRWATLLTFHIRMGTLGVRMHSTEAAIIPPSRSCCLSNFEHFRKKREKALQRPLAPSLSQPLSL